jgi:predicted AlkP superfamily phosphohydrolase/phosphomutase
MDGIMKKTLLIIILAVLLLAAGWLFILRPERPPINPVVVIGLDGADWRIMNPLMERGELPNLTRLMKEGSAGVLKSMRPTKSPVVWTSIATGMGMLKHGILDFRFIDKNNIEVPYSAGERIAKTFWNILGEKGFKVGIINWFLTFPAEKVNGYMISDRLRSGIFKDLEGEGVTYPEDLKDKIFPLVDQVGSQMYPKIRREEGLSDFMSISRKNKIEIPVGREDQIKTFRFYVLQDKSIEKISLHMLDNVTVDTFATYLRLIDTTSHFLSIFIDEDLREMWVSDNEEHGGPTPETEKKLYDNMASLIGPVYSYLDRVVGRIVSHAPENATFIVVSDHGFCFSPKGYNHYETPEIPHGIVIMKGEGIKADHWLNEAHVYDVTPTLLYLHDLPVARDMDGRVISKAFEDSYLRGRKIKYSPTYGKLSKTPEGKRSREMDEEILEELRTLGYIK